MFSSWILLCHEMEENMRCKFLFVFAYNGLVKDRWTVGIRSVEVHVVPRFPLLIGILFRFCPIRSKSNSFRASNYPLKFHSAITIWHMHWAECVPLEEVLYHSKNGCWGSKEVLVLPFISHLNCVRRKMAIYHHPFPFTMDQQNPVSTWNQPIVYQCDQYMPMALSLSLLQSRPNPNLPSPKSHPKLP